MKRASYILLAVSLLLAGCTRQESNTAIKADNISIFYGVSSYALFSADQTIIDDLLGRFSALSFRKTAAKMDLQSAFSVNFYYVGEAVKSFWVDENCVFWLDGDTQCYKVASGSFDYLHLKGLYIGSRSRQAIQKETEKNQLLAMVDKMTKPIQEKPLLAFSSNPYDYIEAYRDTFDSLVAGGQSTVNIFVGVLANSTEFGLDKYIMAAVCAEITGIGKGSDKTWSTAKEWLDLYNERGGNS